MQTVVLCSKQTKSIDWRCCEEKNWVKMPKQSVVVDMSKSAVLQVGERCHHVRTCGRAWPCMETPYAIHWRRSGRKSCERLLQTLRMVECSQISERDSGLALKGPRIFLVEEPQCIVREDVQELDEQALRQSLMAEQLMVVEPLGRRTGNWPQLFCSRRH